MGFGDFVRFCVFIFWTFIIGFNKANAVVYLSPSVLKDVADNEVIKDETKNFLTQKEQEKDLTNFTHGVLSYERREFEEAKSYLVASLAQAELAPYTYYYLGKTAIELKNYNAAYAAFEEALKFKPQFDLQRNIKLEMAKLLMIKNKWPEARQLFLDARKQFKRAEIYPDILWNLFVIDNKQNSQSQCFWFTSLFESYPNYEKAKEWTLDPDTWTYNKKAINCSLNFATKYRHISQLIALGNYQAVQADLEIAKTSMPRLDYLELLANYELRAGNPVAAFDVLKQDYEAYASNPKFLQLYIKVASRALQHEEALNSYDKIIALEKNLRVKAGLIFRKGFLQYELGQYANSYDTMMLVQKTFTNHPYQGDVTWYLGWTAYLQRKHDVALTHFQELYDLAERKKYIRSRDNYSLDRIKYWMAHTYNGLGQTDKAAQFFQDVVESEKLGYYSFLALAYLPEVLPQAQKSKNIEKLLTQLSIPWVQSFMRHNASSEGPAPRNYVLKDNYMSGQDTTLSHEQQEVLNSIFEHEKYKLNLKRFKLLVKSGFHEDARWELQELEKKANDKNQKRELVRLYRQLDDLHRASRIMTLSFQNERDSQITDEDPFVIWSQTYPKPHQTAVVGSAEKFQVPEHLVYSVMRAESFYSKTALSGVGARGLLQLMPFTASQVSDLAGKNELDPEQLFDPDTNIDLGVRYLNRLLKTFAGDKTLAIAAYNAGPHRAEWWVSQFGSLRQDEFIEHILFLETRNYVKKVLQFNWIYDLLYNQQVSFVEIKSPLAFQLSGAPSLTEKWD